MQDETASSSEEKWFVYGPEKKEEVDKYIHSSLLLQMDGRLNFEDAVASSPKRTGKSCHQVLYSFFIFTFVMFNFSLCMLECGDYPITLCWCFLILWCIWMITLLFRWFSTVVPAKRGKFCCNMQELQERETLSN